jgi:hypothetical protein
LLQELQDKQSPIAGMQCGAKFDASGMYRYSLWRAWYIDHPRVGFIMLNPSTADERGNDPTIRRCIDFAHTWQFGSVEVVNLFAYRTTDARELIRVDDPVGKENDLFIDKAIEGCSTIVVSWGTKGRLLGRDRQVLQLLVGKQNVYCLGVTKDGHPRHPLYVRGDTRLVPFRSTMQCPFSIFTLQVLR